MPTLAVTLVLTDRKLQGTHRARRWGIAAAGLLAGAVAGHRALPRLVAGRIQAMLAARGLPDARVEVSGLGFDHLRLTGVTLGEGLDLGELEIDAGISALWRPRIHEVTIRGAELSAAALDRLAQRGHGGPAGGPAGDLPFEVVRIVDGHLAIGGARVAVSGTLAAAGPAVELTATSDRVVVGPAVVRDVRASLRDTGSGLRACATGRIGPATARACTTLPRTLDGLRALRALDATWTAAADRRAGLAGLAASGPRHPGVGRPRRAPRGPRRADRGRAGRRRARRPRREPLGRSRGQPGVAPARRPRHGPGRPAGVPRPHLAHQRARRPRPVRRPARPGRRRGPRDPAPADRRGRARRGDSPPRDHERGHERDHERDRADAIDLAGPSLAAFDADRAIAVDGHLALPRTLRWAARAARIGGAQLRAPSGTLVAGRALQWRAAEARWAGASILGPAGAVEFGAPTRGTATWTAITGLGPIDLGAGELRAHRAGAAWTLDAGRSQALGGELTVEPIDAAVGRPLDLVIHVRGVDLHRVLASFAHGRADGRGALDGEIAIRIAGTGASLQHAALRARPRGTLQLSDPAWRSQASASATGLALHQRIAATLAEFEYLRLAAVLHPAGSDPDVQITTAGRGKRIAQDLDLTINLRGVRGAARLWPFAQSLRSKP